MKGEKRLAGEPPEPPVISSLTPALAPFLLQAEPEPLEIDLQRTAVIVIDMQNAFVKKGGMYDLWGRDISNIPKIIAPIKKITSTARTKGIKVIYVAHHHSPDFHDSGGPNSPNWHKRALTDYREHPEWRDKLHFSGRWGAEIIAELEPQQDDILIIKPRYSAFFGTHLDMVLKTYSIKFLVFTGIATNICVEGAIRDAFNRDYFSILVSDATMNTGPSFMQEAAMFNVKICFGWVTNTENIMKAIEAKETR